MENFSIEIMSHLMMVIGTILYLFLYKKQMASLRPNPTAWIALSFLGSLTIIFSGVNLFNFGSVLTATELMRLSGGFLTNSCFIIILIFLLRNASKINRVSMPKWSIWSIGIGVIIMLTAFFSDGNSIKGNNITLSVGIFLSLLPTMYGVVAKKANKENPKPWFFFALAQLIMVVRVLLDSTIWWSYNWLVPAVLLLSFLFVWYFSKRKLKRKKKKKKKKKIEDSK